MDFYTLCTLKHPINYVRTFWWKSKVLIITTEWLSVCFIFNSISNIRKFSWWSTFEEVCLFVIEFHYLAKLVRWLGFVWSFRQPLWPDNFLFKIIVKSIEVLKYFYNFYALKILQNAIHNAILFQTNIAKNITIFFRRSGTNNLI